MNEALLFNAVFALIGLAVPKFSKYQQLVIVLLGQLVPYLVFGYRLVVAQDGIAQAWTFPFASQDISFVSTLDAGRGLILLGLAPIFLLLSIGVLLGDKPAGEDNLKDYSVGESSLKARTSSILLAQAGTLGIISAGSTLNYIIFWPLLLGAGFLSLLADLAEVRNPFLPPDSVGLVKTSPSKVRTHFRFQETDDHLQDGVTATYIGVALTSSLFVVGSLTFLSTTIGSFDPVVIKEHVMADFNPVWQWWFLLVLFLGVGLLVPVFPIHAWLRFIGPFSSAVTDTILMGITGKIGLLMLAYCGTLMPDAFESFRHALFTVGIFTALYMSIAAFGTAPTFGHLYLGAAYSGLMLIIVAEFSRASLISLAYGFITLPYLVHCLSSLTKHRPPAVPATGKNPELENPSISPVGEWLAVVAGVGIGAFLPGSSGFVWLVLMSIAMAHRFSATAALAVWLAINGLFVVHHRKDLASSAIHALRARRIDFILATLVSLAYGLFPSPLVKGIAQWAKTILGE